MAALYLWNEKCILDKIEFPNNGGKPFEAQFKILFHSTLFKVSKPGYTHFSAWWKGLIARIVIRSGTAIDNLMERWFL